MDFSNGPGSGRAAVTRPTVHATTADIIRRSGLGIRYAHATGRAAAGTRDLADSRARLLEEGYIYKENFVDPEVGRWDDEAEEKYDEERRTNDARAARLSAAERKAEGDAVAFDRWTSIKEAIDTARACLAILPCQLPAADAGGGGGGGSSGGGRRRGQ